MVFGEERLFIIQCPGVPSGVIELFLKFMGKDQSRLKMKGNFPRFWTVQTDKISGPLLVDEDSIYEVVTMDYDHNFIWISQADIPSSINTTQL